MKQLTLEAFLNDLAWSDNMRHVLRIKADRDDLRALSANLRDGRLVAAAYTQLPDDWPDDTVAIWCKRPLQDNEMGKSKTMQAVDLVLNEGLTVYAAAKKIGVNQSAVHRALQRRGDKEICPCCGQVIREGFSLDQSKVKTPGRRSASS